VLISIDQFPTRDSFAHITLTISSDEVGVFEVSAAYMGMPVPDGKAELRMDDLVRDVGTQPRN
jgi:Ras GTPase-activating-like protein IQGAP2/3